MTLITRLFAVSSLLAVSVQAIQVSHGSGSSSHHQVAREFSEKNPDLEKRAPGKVGVAWANYDYSNVKDFYTSKTTFFYNWSPYPDPKVIQAGFRFCSMLWGTKQIGQFQKLKNSKGKCAMGMNEVNVPSQGQLTVAEGIKLWNSYIRDLSQEGFLLVSPSVTCGADGLAWLKAFYKGCGGKAKKCNVDATALHIYVTTVAEFKNCANTFHDALGGDFWITEFACEDFSGRKKCSATDVNNFMNGAVSWMEATPWIRAYFAFGLFWDLYNVQTTNRLVNSNGLPNARGHAYLHGITS